MQKRTDFFDNSLSRIVPDIPLVIRNKPHNNQLCADLSRLISAYPVVSHFLRFAWQTTTYDQSIDRSQAGIQNFSPGADGLIDAIERSTVEEKVKKQIDYDCLISHPDCSVVQMAEEIKDLMVDVLYGERSVVSEGKRVSEETAKAAYRKITFDHVQYVMKSLVSYSDKISRIDRFLTASLFNSVYTLKNSTFAGFEYDCV